jgi:hypothetical protein
MMRARQPTPEENAGIARIFRITASGIGRIYLVAIAIVIVMFLPLPWRDELGKAYGYYALVVLVLGLGVIYTLGFRQIRSIRRVKREVQSSREETPSS